MNKAGAKQAYRKSDLARHSFFLMLLLPCFLSAEAASIVLLGIFFVWLILSNLRIGKGFFSLVAPFLALLAIGSVGVAYYPPMDVVKDIWYVGKVIVAIGSGFVLARYLSDIPKMLNIVVLAGAIAALVHMIEILIYGQDGLILFDLRVEEGVRGYFVTVIALALVVSLPRSMLRLNLHHYYLIAAVCTLSLFASFSRTYIIALIVLVLILKGWARISLNNLAKVAVVVGFVAIIIVVQAQSATTGEKSLTEKFVNSMKEVMIQDYSELRDINQHWRGFESYRAMLDFQGAGGLQQLFGQGLGARIDLGFYMKLGGSELRYIPVLHNGYLYVLVKFGVLGLLIYIYFLMKMIMSISYIGDQKSKSFEFVIISRFVAAMGWLLLFTTFVIAGAFNKSTILPVLVLLGFFVGKMRGMHALKEQLS